MTFQIAIGIAIAISISNKDRDRDRDLNFGDRGHALPITPELGCNFVQCNALLKGTFSQNVLISQVHAQLLHMFTILQRNLL